MWLYMQSSSSSEVARPTGALVESMSLLATGGFSTKSGVAAVATAAQLLAAEAGPRLIRPVPGFMSLLSAAPHVM